MLSNCKIWPMAHDRMERTSVQIASEEDILLARRLGRELVSQANFTALDSTLIVTAISELARNILQHAGQGTIMIGIVRQEDNIGVIVVAQDSGPGIHDVKMALRDGFSTSGSLGLGLPGVRRIADEFDVVSHPNLGTTVTAKIWARMKPGVWKSDSELRTARAHVRSSRPNDLAEKLGM